MAKGLRPEVTQGMADAAPVSSHMPVRSLSKCYDLVERMSDTFTEAQPVRNFRISKHPDTWPYQPKV